MKKLFSASKIFPFLIILSLSSFGMSRLYTWLADGFSRYNISSEFAYRDHLQIQSPSTSELASINAILKQEYHYWARGAQSYAFLSEDGKYVLKLVKQQHYKFSPIENMLLKIPFLLDVRQKKLKTKKRKIENFLQSCLIASHELDKETALLYLHLTPTHRLHPHVRVSDRLGWIYEIGLDQTEFLLQEKAELVTSRIDFFMKNNEIEQAQNALQQIVNLLIQCSRKGISDRDTKLIHNVGFIGQKAIYIDVGEFYKDDRLKDPEYCLEHIILQTFPLKKWLLENHPVLLF